ncbi:hypothetical protein [Streptomyces sp. NEAU-174]|uniref:hypothetical protein n=1 Tax=Streptomyces sp. NEAU-174 TaxID=3458254 RepID=UPI0040451118
MTTNPIPAEQRLAAFGERVASFDCGAELAMYQLACELRDELAKERAEADRVSRLLGARDIELERLRDRAESAGEYYRRAQEAKKRIAELEAAASAGLKSLSSFIFDTTDPGVDALGAQWLLQKVMPQVDNPFAEPNRYRDEILRQAAKRQRDFIVSDDYVCDDWEAALDVVDLIDPDEQTATSEGG